MYLKFFVQIMNYFLIKRILKRHLEDNNSDLAEFAKNKFGIKCDAFAKRFQGRTKFSFKEVEEIVKYCKGQIKYEDFCQDTTSSDKNNTNNDEIVAKNSASEVMKPDDVG